MVVVQFPCPSCQQLLQLPAANAGQRYRCPQCQFVGVIPSASPPQTDVQPNPPPPGVSPSADVFRIEEDVAPPPVSAPDPRWYQDENPEPARSRNRSRLREEALEEARAESPQRLDERLAAWQKVRWGLKVIYFALVIWCCTVALTLLTLCALPLAGATGTGLGSSREVGLLVAGLFLFVGGVGLLVNIAQMAGYGLCLFVPSRHGALGWAIGALVLTFLSFGLSIVGLIVPGVPLVAMLMGLAGWASFLLFLRAVGVELDVSWLIQEIQSLITLLVLGVGGTGLAMAVLALLAGAFAGRMRTPHNTAANLVGCVTLCFSGLFVTLLFVVLFRYLHVLRDTAAQIEEELSLRVQPLTGKSTRRLRDY